MADIVREPVLVRRAGGGPKPKYRESAYQRPLIQRFTPFTWFSIVFCALGVVIAAIFIVTRPSTSQHPSVSLPERLAELQKINPTSFALTAAAQAPANQLPPKSAQTNKVAALPAAATARPSPTQVPTPTPTPNPNDAPWAGELVQQADGTFVGPKVVIDQVLADLGAYYTGQRDLSLDDYLRQRYDLLDTYFTGAALTDMRTSEANRKHYELNRAGAFVVQVRNFTVDGYTAKVGVMKRGWVNDIYDVTSRKLVAEGVAQKDSLSVMTITYDRSAKRWKFDAIEVVKEVQP
ncbi:MAG TPA: hypothetical protein VGK81_10650 [Anaerolineae bacterium]